MGEVYGHAEDEGMLKIVQGTIVQLKTFSLPSELDSDNEQDGVVFLDSQIYSNKTDVDDDGFTYVRGKQSKRKKISSEGQSDQINLRLTQNEEFFVHGGDVSHFEHMTAEDKLLNIINKLAVNEGRVSSIQTKLDSIFKSPRSKLC